MRRCDHCEKWVWFWQAGIESRFGYTHLPCLDILQRRELWKLISEVLIEAFRIHAERIKACR